MEQKKVLIVEDEKPVQQLVALLVESHKAAVTVVGSSLEANNILKDKNVHFDLVILDLILPGITGWDILDAMKSNPETKDTPIIIFTGASLSEKEKEKILQKADAVIEKNEFTLPFFEKNLDQWL